MARPELAEWEVLDLREDPTPGDPDVLRNLAAEYQKLSDEAAKAHETISRIKNSELGKGKSMEELRKVLDDLPGQVAALRDSYETASEAVNSYHPLLKDHQDKAAIALANGKEAKTRLDAAIQTAAAASAHVSSLNSATPPPPDDEQAKASARQALNDANSAVSTANAAVDAAQSDLDAAKQLAREAQGLRESDASTAASSLGHAKDQAVKKKNFWDKLWDTIGSIFGIISAVLGVISFLIPGLGAIGLVIGTLSLVMGLVPLGINIARGVVTGDWDVAGIVLGTLGAGFGGFAVVKGLSAGWGGIWKGAGQNLKGIRGGPIKPTPAGRPPAPEPPPQPQPPRTPTPEPNPTPPATTPPPAPKPPTPTPPPRPSSAPPASTPPRPPAPKPDPPAPPPRPSSAPPRPSTPTPDPPPRPSSAPPHSTTPPPRPPAPTPDPPAPPPRPSSAPPHSTPPPAPRPPSPEPPPAPRPPSPEPPPAPRPPSPEPPHTYPPRVTDPLPDNPGMINQWVQDLKTGVWGWQKIPGNIGSGTAFGGTIYAPGATSGAWSGTVHAGDPDNKNGS